MTSDEFNEVIARIADAFPKKTYSIDQMQRLYGEIRGLTYRNFQDAVIALLDGSTYHPTVNAIRQACGPYLANLRALNRSFSGCIYCYGNGQLDMVKTVKGQQMRFAVACCYCNAADIRGLSRTLFPRVSKDDFERREEDALSKQVAKNRADPNYPRGKGRLKEKIAYLTGDAAFAEKFCKNLASNESPLQKLIDKQPPPEDPF